MSGENVKKVIARAVSDAGFRELLFRDPDGALAEYNLTEQEKDSILSGLSREGFDALSSDLGERTSRAGIHLGDMIGEIAEEINPEPIFSEASGSRDEVAQVDALAEGSNDPVPLPDPADEVSCDPIPMPDPADELGDPPTPIQDPFGINDGGVNIMENDDPIPRDEGDVGIGDSGAPGILGDAPAAEDDWEAPIA